MTAFEDSYRALVQTGLTGRRPAPMTPIALDGVFRVWRYGVGHSQLLLRNAGADHQGVGVLFEGVRAVKLRTSYPGLEIRPVHGPDRERLLDFAGLPGHLRRRELCLALPTEDHGFVVCGRVTVLTGESDYLSGPPASGPACPAAPPTCPPPATSGS